MRHERVIIIILTYIIGFTTAFIAFGLNTNTSTKVTDNSYEVTKNAPKAAPKKITADYEPSVVGEAIQPDGLYALIDGRYRVLSAQVINAATTRDGYHYRIVTTDASPNGEFIYFCSQKVQSSDSCQLYVYELDSDVVYKVKDTTGNILELPLRGGIVDWLPDGRLEVGRYTSVTANRPWQLQ